MSEEKEDLKKVIETLEKEIEEIKQKLKMDKEGKSILELPVEKGKELTNSLLSLSQKIIKVASAAANGAIEGAKKALEEKGENKQEVQENK